MNNIYLPDLLSLNIKNFTLYPNGLNFNYTFIKGVNLIIGGNGMGKTTLINIIKYSVIGHYKDGLDLTRTYKDRKIEKRTSYPGNYFSKRSNPVLKSDAKPSVTAKFKINETEFEIERCLHDISILKLSVDGGQIKGDIINQLTYDNLVYEYSRLPEGLPREELLVRIEKSLLNKYEKAVEKASNMPYDDLIFFINKILFFGEDHKTILWDDDSYSDVQTELFNKYFNDRELNDLRQEATRQAKYFDTQSRHRSEDIRVIKNVLEKSQKNTPNDSIDNVNNQIDKLKNALESLNYKIESTQEQRNQHDSDLKVISNKINSLSQEATQLEKNQKKIERELVQSNWIKLNRNYDLYQKSIQSNEICPMCSQELDQSYIQSKVQHPEKCILCEQEISQNKSELLTNEQLESKDKLHKIYFSINELQHQIYHHENVLNDLDKNFKNLGVEKRQLVSQLRLLEYENIKDKDSKGENSLQVFYDEIADLEIKKDEFQEKSKEQKEIALQISNKIEDQIITNTIEFSSLFSGYAEKFLGVKCKLTFEEFNGQKRFYPVIDGKIREREEELSESQRFFVDHSFRMSILSFFYNKPSFYIVETPDSSLDISYERNAADVFKKFITSYPYCLILTTNLNNSEFLNYLVTTHEQIEIVDLLKIGNKSPIQISNVPLNTIYNKLINSINEK